MRLLQGTVIVYPGATIIVPKRASDPFTIAHDTCSVETPVPDRGEARCPACTQPLAEVRPAQ